MKRVVCIIVVLFLAVMIIGCANSNSNLIENQLESLVTYHRSR